MRRDHEAATIAERRQVPPQRVFFRNDPDFPTTEAARRLLEGAGRVHEAEGGALTCHTCRASLVDDDDADREEGLCSFCVPASRARDAGWSMAPLPSMGLDLDEIRLAVGMRKRHPVNKIVDALNGQRTLRYGNSAVLVTRADVLCVVAEAHRRDVAEHLVWRVVKAGSDKIVGRERRAARHALWAGILGMDNAVFSASTS